MSDSYDPLMLLKLNEKIILKESDNQYKIAIIMKKLKLLLAYCQDDRVTNAAYYDRFKTRVDVAEHIGVSFDNPVFWDWKSQELTALAMICYLIQLRKISSRRISSRHPWHTYSSSIATIRSIVS